MSHTQSGAASLLRSLAFAAVLSPMRVLALFIVLGRASVALAVPITYFGLDSGAGPSDPRPNSEAAAASFLTATTSINLDTFEQFATGPGPNILRVPDIPVSLAVAPTVSLSSSLPESGGQSIGSPGSRSGFSTGGDRSFLGVSAGYNTTPGGQVFLFMDTPEIGDSGAFGGYWQFAFSTPVSAFGAFVTGWNSGGAGNVLYFEFNDGANQSLTFVGDSNESTLFFGFTDPGATITSLLVRQDGANLWSMDDMYYGAAVPEPSSLALASIGCLAVMMHRRYRTWPFRASKRQDEPAPLVGVFDGTVLQSRGSRGPRNLQRWRPSGSTTRTRAAAALADTRIDEIVPPHWHRGRNGNGLPPQSDLGCVLRTSHRA